MKLPLLLDANVIILCCRLGLWDLLVERSSVIAPSIVIHDEALFYAKSPGAIEITIDLPGLVSQGKILEMAADLAELAALGQIFDPVMMQGLHAGESEALALVHAGKVPEDYLFCSADAAAIQAFAMLGYSDRCISLGEVLQKLGLSRAVPEHFTLPFLKKHLAIGAQRRITGQGLRVT